MTNELALFIACAAVIMDEWRALASRGCGFFRFTAVSVYMIGALHKFPSKRFS